MNAWNNWFASFEDKMVDRGGPCGAGREITNTGTKEFPLDKEALTGYCIIQAEKIAKDCPIITSIRVYEAMSM